MVLADNPQNCFVPPVCTLGQHIHLKKSIIDIDLFDSIRREFLGSFLEDSHLSRCPWQAQYSKCLARWQPSCKFPCCAVGKGELFRAERGNLGLKSRGAVLPHSFTPSSSPSLTASGGLFTSRERTPMVSPLLLQGAASLSCLWICNLPSLCSSEITRCEMMDVVRH